MAGVIECYPSKTRGTRCDRPRHLEMGYMQAIHPSLWGLALFERDYELSFRRASSFPHISHWPWAGRINKDIIQETAANTKVPNEFPTSQPAQTHIPSAGNLCKAITPTRLKFPCGGQDQRQDSVRRLPVHLGARRHPRTNYSARHHHL